MRSHLIYSSRCGSIWYHILERQSKRVYPIISWKDAPKKDAREPMKVEPPQEPICATRNLANTCAALCEDMRKRIYTIGDLSLNTFGNLINLFLEILKTREKDGVGNTSPSQRNTEPYEEVSSVGDVVIKLDTGSITHHDIARSGNSRSWASPLFAPKFWSYSFVDIGF